VAVKNHQASTLEHLFLKPIMNKTNCIKITAFLWLAMIAASCSQKSDKKFQQLSASKTGISFINEVKETADVNILDYLYYYNGGGVATADFNADGLNDLYFVSTQGENKMYINKGKTAPLQFEDITATAGVGGKANWQTGVTVADVNGDNRPDIYVCAVGKYKSLKGRNELYINVGNDANGQPKFEEKAAEYGLDFSGFSTQAAFIDYDKDGDLDMYLLTHAIHSVSSYDKVSARSLVDSSAGDVLYRNELISTTKPTQNLPKFTNVSAEAGIYQAPMGYGLGISVADFNNDGWDDIYVTNDFHEDDYYYLNNGNGTFKEAVKEHFRHLSKYSMGCDAADINNDGWTDIFTADMQPDNEKVEKSSLGEDALDIFLYKLQFGFYNQYSHNALQLNLAGKRYAEIALSTGTSATDWSWSPLLADFDNDGQRDLFVSNGIPRRPDDLDYSKYINQDSVFMKMSGSSLMVSKTTDLKALEQMPTGKAHNYIFKGNKSLTFEDKSTDWGFEDETVSNGALYVDLDNDGDLEIVTNDLNQSAGIFQNMTRETDPAANYLRIKLEGNTANTAGFGAKIYIKNKAQLQVATMQPTRGFESASEAVVHFGLGNAQQIDSLIVCWPNGKTEIKTNVKANQLLTLKQTAATTSNTQHPTLTINHQSSTILTDITDKTILGYQHKETPYIDMIREPMMPFQYSTQGVKPAVGDINGDGLDDLYLGGARDQPGQVMVQRAGGRFEQTNQAVMQADAANEDAEAVFFDADGDRDLDLYVVSGGNEYVGDMAELQDRLYVNDGKGNFTKNINALPTDMRGNKLCVKPADFDNDGDTDLFVGGRVIAYKYGVNPQSYLLVNDGKGHFSDQTAKIAPAIQKIGLVSDAAWADIDNDKDLDLTIVGDWLGIEIFENKNKTFNHIANNESLSKEKGLWQTIQVADFDRDGDVDFMVGNLGTNNKFIKDKQPEIKMYVKDIDGNGSTEQVVAYKRNNEFYPLLGRDELGKQLPSVINKRFTNYKDFAGQTLNEILKNELKNADEKTVNRFESVYVENKGKGQFNVKPLPFEVQFSKVFAFEIGDFDNDGHLDALAGGNLYGVSTYQGRYDASYGWLLKGDGKGNFKALWPTQSGFFVDGELRGIKSLKINEKKSIITTLLNQKARIFTNQ
jgi:enediyne biosynthesis protein E4